ncbi:MAG: hypothetical protein GY805_32365 [Chloroflexi bacterium]|nr:hypothetical protein [Chloroflexota bacterium]
MMPQPNDLCCQLKGQLAFVQNNAGDIVQVVSGQGAPSPGCPGTRASRLKTALSGQKPSLAKQP